MMVDVQFLGQPLLRIAGLQLGLERRHGAGFLGLLVLDRLMEHELLS